MQVLGLLCNKSHVLWSHFVTCFSKRRLKTIHFLSYLPFHSCRTLSHCLLRVGTTAAFDLNCYLYKHQRDVYFPHSMFKNNLKAARISVLVCKIAKGIFLTTSQFIVFKPPLSASVMSHLDYNSNCRYGSSCSILF